MENSKEFITLDRIYTVGPHGEILPHVLRAFRQGVDRRIVHIDAHPDKAKSSINDKTGKEYNGEALQQLAEQFMDGSVHIHEIEIAIQGDVETFLYALKNIVRRISAVMRFENWEAFRWYDAKNPEDYFKNTWEVPGFTMDHIKDLEPVGVLSIDADFVACTRDREEMRAQNLIDKRLRLLSEVVDYLYQRDKPLITVSVDPDFCTHAEEVLKAIKHVTGLPTDR